MSFDLSRRGLLGLIAAAPVAAVAKPAAALVHGVEGSFLGIDGAGLSSGWAISEGVDFSLYPGPAGERLAILSPETVARLAAPVDLDLNHEPPPGGQSLAGHGPDAAYADRKPIASGCDHVAPDAASGPSLSLDRDNDAFLKIARAL